ncbi:hypothetical protein FISHEDRAFT_49365, partial [Fistulina hepatica ATCC 64428]
QPKATRRRSRIHDSSAKLSRKRFADIPRQPDHIDIGGASDVPAPELLEQINDEASPVVLKKKEKQQLKREAFLSRLESPNTPYSKSHGRRMKRKAKEQLASGLGDIEAIVTAMESKMDEETPDQTIADSNMPSSTANTADLHPGPPNIKPGLIGQGKAQPLSKAQRKKALKLEKLRHPLILANEQYSTNPFQTIRTHAQNTLLKYQPPSSEKK